MPNEPAIRLLYPTGTNPTSYYDRNRDALLATYNALDPPEGWPRVYNTCP